MSVLYFIIFFNISLYHSGNKGI
uniref:Uncharacterized protein n=1 Tax=Rhizophora mucronata TaxID=61149 RepID=A0A2P2P571_RHIMU